MKCLFVIAALAIFYVPAFAESRSTPTDYDYFQLWNGCKPTKYLILDLSSDAAEIGLTKERIETLTRSRLRAARLYSNDPPETRTYLFVNFNVGSRHFSTSIQFKKHLFDYLTLERGGGTGFATTWETGNAGTHGQDAGYILQGFSELVDEFIDEYLRVNEEAC